MAESPIVWIPRPVHDDALVLLREHADVRLGYGEEATTFEEIADRVVGILLRTARVDGEMMRRAPALSIVARHGVGLDTVDLVTAGQRGITVTTTPTANTRSVAEHTIALLLAVRRGIGIAVRGEGDVRASIQGRELAGSTLGLIGFGRIAASVAHIARHGFGMRVLAFDPMRSAEDIAADGAEPATLAELLAASDAVSLHVPLTPETRSLIGLDELLAMPKGGVVLNTSRGGTLDEAALLTALRRGHLAGAGLDVTVVEPLPADHPLRQEPTVIITPHVGAQTAEAMRRMATDAANRIIEHLS
ncbi:MULTISPECIES: NAD(P)-dependent oxidoreductase [Actinoalloteichus]|uniref:Phosphoglycerate dehydrogenase-like oxidoreductase n=1 Tax=Actinoalloteichus fjordicus TaxID=1612552 RepID=A0AAC9LAQ6_9PSEU|nr:MULTISPECIES: NAD(P)-dependent oxidoreductase [Actinoalloteichus]APU13202.1 phosphoglycerate dehydrogenase-like oxidoreductase [Actinoalloteichus fjordicus]APU19153.1 phosphoglycerate dehydrogenase-like oxidoreductase [Actinoalloteichus sp. GBA129-24]